MKKDIPFFSHGSIAGAIKIFNSNFRTNARALSVSQLPKSLVSDEDKNYTQNNLPLSPMKNRTFMLDNDIDDKDYKGNGSVKILNESTISTASNFNDLSVNLGQGEFTNQTSNRKISFEVDQNISEDNYKSITNQRTKEYSSKTYQGSGRHSSIRTTSMPGANLGSSTITLEIPKTVTSLLPIVEKSEVQSNNIEIEDLLVLEEKLQEILTNMRVNKQSRQTCIEWWTFSTGCDFHEKLFSFFNKNTVCSKSVQESTLLEYYSIIICYDASSDANIFSSTVNLLKNLFYIVHQNFLIVCDLIVSCLGEQNLTNLWENKLQKVIISKLANRIKKGEHSNVLRNNIENIASNFKNIFRTYPSPGKSGNVSQKSNASKMAKVICMFKNFSKTTIMNLNDLFKEMIEPINFQNAQKNKLSKISSSSLLSTSSEPKFSMSCANRENLPNVSVPYLTTPITKSRELTLILDLDETIVYVESDKTKPYSSLGLKINMRPYLLQFLEECSQFYEIIIFTAALQDYADPIIDYIENKAKKRYFDHRLYRQHAAAMNGDFVKDISKIGRQISKVVIVDDIRNNFKLQKENGILIKSYERVLDSKIDRVLLDLSEILVILAKTTSADIRKTLMNHKSEILKKITCI